jgi:hypothetical protein
MPTIFSPQPNPNPNPFQSLLTHKNVLMCRQHPINLRAAFYRNDPLQPLRRENFHNGFALRE